MQTVSPESVGLSSSRLERLERAMQGYIDRREFAGIITLVARRGQVAHLARFGWQEIETDRPMAFDTIFRIYSMTKPITSAAAMMLVEEGRLRLSDPVSRYVPAFKQAKVIQPRGNGGDFDLVPAAREITLHDLLTHTAGLGYGDDELSVQSYFYRQQLQMLMEKGEIKTLGEQVKAIAGLPLAFHPGTAFRYSVAISVLGYVIELASGMPFDRFLQERIFRPLGMVDTAFFVPPEKLSRFAAVYGPAEGGGIKVIEPAAGSQFTRSDRILNGGGGLVSTAEDYFRFGQMLLNRGELEGARLLGRQTVEWMLQNHLPAGIHPFDEKCNGFGLGGAVLINPGLSHRPGSLGKFGWGGAANTEWWIDPHEELNCLLLTQYFPPFTLPLVEDFAQTVYQALE